MFAEKTRYEHNRREDIVINTAFIGNTTRDLLSNFDWRVAQFNPTVVFLMDGMNDCVLKKVHRDEFRSILRTLLSKSLKLALCRFYRPPIRSLKGTPQPVNNIFQRIGKQCGDLQQKTPLHFADHYSNWLTRSAHIRRWMADPYFRTPRDPAFYTTISGTPSASLFPQAVS